MRRALFLCLCLTLRASADPVAEQENREPKTEAEAQAKPRPPRKAGAHKDLHGWDKTEKIIKEFAKDLQNSLKFDFKDWMTKIGVIDNDSFKQSFRTFLATAELTSDKELRGRVKYALWQERIRRDPKDPSGHAGLGQHLSGEGDFPGAFDSFSRAIQLGEATPENYYGRGFAAEALGDHELANKDAQRALNLHADNASAYALYKLTDGRISRLRLDPDGVAAEASPQQPAAPPPAPDRMTLGATQPPPARREETDPLRQSQEMLRVAQRFLQLGDFQAAADSAAKAVALDPGNAQAYNILAIAQERLGRHELALASTGRALELAPESVPALDTRAWTLNSLGRHEEALAASKQALALNPSDSYAYLNKARAEGGLNRREDMLDSLRRASSADSRFRGVYDRARSLPQAGDVELLFNGLFEANRPAAPAPEAPAAKLPGNWRGVLTVWLLTLTGGFLVTFGLLHIFLNRRKDQSVLARLARRPMIARGREKGSELDRYELKRVIATGGMGVVYEAADRALKRRVAVKKMRGEIRDDAQERDRFLKEARTVAQLRHPNIVQIYSIFEDRRDVYLVFEFVEGATLKDILAARKSLPLAEVRDILSGVCSALEYAHARGVIHRDLKPSNIMLDEEKNAKVMDFGVARYAKDALVKAAATSTLVGTPQYMAPEAEEGTICRQSDLYSLGVCLYELVTGRPPFKGSSGAMYADKLAGRFEPPSRSAPVPKKLDAVVARLLAPDPEDRFTSAQELRAALEDL